MSASWWLVVFVAGWSVGALTVWMGALLRSWDNDNELAALEIRCAQLEQENDILRMEQVDEWTRRREGM
jgi:hypothetical protein